VSGRVNSLCFSPDQPILSIGTGTKKLVSWNYQHAAIQQVRRDFNHSISQVAYAGPSTLLCGVRSSSQSVCWIYGWHGNEAFVLPGHRGAVTALLPIQNNRLLSTGRDGSVVLWDLSTHQEINRLDAGEWPRAAAFTEQGPYLAIATGDQVRVIEASGLSAVFPLSLRSVGKSNLQPGVAHHLTFCPAKNAIELLAGQANGQVVNYQINLDEHTSRRKLLIDHHSAIIGLQFLPGRTQFISASSDGELRMTDWQNVLPPKKIKVTERATAMTVSPDGAYLALASGESDVYIIDLRLHALPEMLSVPTGKITSNDFALISSLLQNPGLPGPVSALLRLYQALLERRFRFDIHVEDLIEIQPGEFDILVD
jgi:WD40 repeat protein